MTKKIPCKIIVETDSLDNHIWALENAGAQEITVNDVPNEHKRTLTEAYEINVGDANEVNWPRYRLNILYLNHEVKLK